VQDLTSESYVLSFINTLVADGGGDTPEAVIDGLERAANQMSWR
jgi:hypothetical protein